MIPPRHASDPRCCAECAGRGSVPCDSCDGEDLRCPSCEGLGELVCHTCDGGGAAAGRTGQSPIREAL